MFFISFIQTNIYVGNLQCAVISIYLFINKAIIYACILIFTAFLLFSFCCCCCCYFEIGFLHIALLILELTLQTRQASNSDRFICLPRAGTTGNNFHCLILSENFSLPAPCCLPFKRLFFFLTCVFIGMYLNCYTDHIH